MEQGCGVQGCGVVVFQGGDVNLADVSLVCRITDRRN